MEHESFRDLISLASDDRLPETERELLAGHLSDCNDCRLFAAGIESASQILRNAQPEKRSEAFVQSVLARLPEVEEQEGFPLRWFAPVFAGAFAVVVAVWTPTVTTAFAGPDSLITASLEEPVLNIWGEGQ